MPSRVEMVGNVTAAVCSGEARVMMIDETGARELVPRAEPPSSAHCPFLKRGTHHRSFRWDLSRLGIYH